MGHRWLELMLSAVVTVCGICGIATAQTVASSIELGLAAWNVENFGPTKMARPQVCWRGSGRGGRGPCPVHHMLLGTLLSGGSD